MIANPDVTSMMLSRGDWPVRYPLGLAAMLLCLEHLRPGNSLLILFASTFLLLCCTTDTFLGEIPNPLNLALIVAGLIHHGTAAGWTGIAFALAGLLLGGALLLIPYLLGGMGGGDVKALAALGTLLGAAEIFQTFLYAGLIGGLISLVYLLVTPRGGALGGGTEGLRLLFRTGDWRGLQPAQTGKGMRFPYAVAYGFGFYAYRFWGGLL